jgi:hypothetical protein
MDDMDFEPLYTPINPFWKGVAGAALGFLVAMAFAWKGVWAGLGAIVCMVLAAIVTRYFVSPD